MSYIILEKETQNYLGLLYIGKTDELRKKERDFIVLTPKAYRSLKGKEKKA